MLPHWSWALILAGSAMFGGSLFYAWRRRRFLARSVTVTGTVTELSTDTSNQFPKVDYLVDGNELQHQPRSGISHDVKVGDRIPVAYDPNVPARASIETPAAIAARRMLVRLMVGGGLFIIATGIVMWFTVRPLELDARVRDEVIERYLRAIREGRPVDDLVTTDYTAPPATILERIRKSTGYSEGNSAANLHDACMRGTLKPEIDTVVFRFIEAGTWRIQRVAKSDPCELDLD